MERLKRERAPERSAVTRTITLLEAGLKKKPSDPLDLEALLQTLDQHVLKLAELDERVKDLLLDEETSAEAYEAEHTVISEYLKKVTLIKVKVNSVLYPKAPPSPTPSQQGSRMSGTSSAHRKRSYRLPKTELRKFSGNLKEWLGWWASFEKIHEDEDMDIADKFDYLFQAMVAGTRVYELVDGYPRSKENYPKVIGVLKNRYGNPKLLKQVYVRELISMILLKNREKVDISSLYDKLESHLRSLESLGVTVEQTVEFLFPMVESSLPESILLAWQRSPNFGVDGTTLDPPRSELDFLMSFLKQEIDNEEHRKLARSGFGLVGEKKKGQSKKELEEEDLPTAAGLFSGTGVKLVCLFCGKGHESGKCFKAQKMTMEEKEQKVKKFGACFVCLGKGHIAKKCKEKVKCSLCEKRHQTLFCPIVHPKSAETPKADSTVTLNGGLNCTSEVILQTLRVEIQNPVSKVKKIVRVLIDNGSQKSYILKKTVKKLGLVSVAAVCVNHELFGGSKVLGKWHNVYQVNLSSLSSGFSTRLALMDDDQICGTLPRATRGDWTSQLKQKGIEISDLDPRNSSEIEVMLGSDLVGPLLAGSIFQLDNGLTATETKFGWTVMGPQEGDESEAMSVTSMTISSSTVAELWNLEAIGIQDPIEVKTREEKEQAAHDHFLQTVTRDANGRYTVCLPWIDGEKSLPSNHGVAFKRLQSTTRKLNDLGKFTDYDEIFKTWESEGIISRVDVATQDDSSCHYLPHRAVFKESRTTPVRPVFDASCKSGRSPSLNDCLEKGPNLLELIPSILLRFRMRKIGVIADIRKAFLMIEVKDEDRNYLRFLWWEDSQQKVPKIYRHNRVVFGMNCSPFLLGAVIGFHLKNELGPLEETVRLIEKSLYVDNLVVSVDNQSDYEKVKTEATEILGRAQMELRQWERSGVADENPLTSVLGMKWDKLKDVLSCDSIPAEVPQKITKRVILSQLQRIFDPLGFLSPMLLIPKLLLQRAWKESRQWDVEVTSDILKEFMQWWEEISEILPKIQIPRNCTGGVKEAGAKMELHAFSDASQSAYAAAVFLRTESLAGVSVQLLQAKTRVAPCWVDSQKRATIPRLELMSCTISARLVSTVKKALSMDEVPTYFWNDSSTALSWIKRNDDWGTFVGNRVKEICQLTRPDDWSHIPGIHNPADLPSRGINPRKFEELKWWEGPGWLKSARSNWPGSEFVTDEAEINQERKKVPSIKTLLAQTTETPWYVVKSTYYGTLRVMSIVFRFVDKIRKRSKEWCRYPTLEEINSTEMRLYGLVQRESFSDEDDVISGLKVGRDTAGIIRVRTKLLHRQDSIGFKRPILLPNSHPLVDSLILNEHLKNSHGGAQFIIGRLREKVWIVQGRKAVTKVLRSCVTCRRFDSKKTDVPRCALPEDRVKDASAFQVTGIDLAGPLTLKNKNKVWVVLFTCGVFRCVHLELVESLSTEDFLLAFVRFCKRKRRPETVYSDNGSNFVGANNLFKKIDWELVQKRTQQMRIDWKFNPPAAPWWGGWWERLIRSVKDLLRRMLGFQKLTYAELETCLCEVEYVVNHRPLTFVSEDLDDLIPITPAMFIYALPETEVPESKLLKVESLGTRKRGLDKLLQELKDRFRKEYLGQLVQRGKDPKSRQFKVGEIVLVEKEDKKRILWPMARILELIPGKDGIVRVARIRTKTGNYLRPIQRLFPLEVPFDETDPIVLTGKMKKKEVIQPETGQIVLIGKPKKRDVLQPKKSDVLQPISEEKTRKGRVIKVPIRFCEY